MLYSHGDISIRELRAEDAKYLNGFLRSEDADEIGIFGHKDFMAHFDFAISQSIESYAMLYKGIPCAMFGICPTSLLGSDANIWLLGTPEMAHVKKTFMKLSRLFIGEWLNKYPRLWNLVPCDYEKSLKWLKWLGAEINGPLLIKDAKYNIISFVKG